MRRFRLIYGGLIEFLEQLGSELGGCGSPHHLVSVLCLLLIIGQGVFAVRKQLLGCERARMVLVGIQGR